jgi:hypothetical protein
MSMVGLNSYVQTHTSTGGLQNVMPGNYGQGNEGFVDPLDTANSVPISDETSMLAMEKYCKEYNVSENPFNDPTFAANCGVCLSSGNFNDAARTPIADTPGGTGVLVYQQDKQRAYDRQVSNNYRYPRAMPSLGRAMCVGATSQEDDSKPPTLAIDANMYTDIKYRKECIKAADFTADKSCGRCVTDPTSWSYIKNPPNGDLNPVTLVLSGSGKVTVTVNGSPAMIVTDTGLAPMTETSLSTTPISVLLSTGAANEQQIQEGQRFIVSVKQVGTTIPFVGGLLQSKSPNGEKYVQEFYNTIVKDTANSGNVPKVGQPKVPITTNGVSVKRIIPTTPLPTPVAMVLECEMPVTFISPVWDPTTNRTQIAYYDCSAGPYVNSQGHADNIIKDECTGQLPASYTDSCLGSIITGAGCSTGGTWYRNGLPQETRGMNTGQLTNWIKDQQKMSSTDPTVAIGCYGLDISSPCDKTNPDGTPTDTCLKYLYENTIERNPRYGPAYNTQN